MENLEAVVVPVEETTNVAEFTGSPQEEKARAGGWKPLEEWDGDPEEWIDARAFNRNGEYIDHIKSLSSENKKAQKKLTKLEQEMSILAQHHAKVAEIEKAKALKELKDLRKEALSNLDADRVVEIEDRIEELNKAGEVKPQRQQVEQYDYQDVVDAWREDNTWYDEDRALRAAANGLIQEMLQEDPSLKEDPGSLLKDVAKQLKVEFPNKFGSRTRTTSATVEANSEGRVKNASYARKLTAEQRQIGKTLVDHGALTSIEEYAKQLHEIGELK